MLSGFTLGVARGSPARKQAVAMAARVEGVILLELRIDESHEER